MDEVVRKMSNEKAWSTLWEPGSPSIEHWNKELNMPYIKQVDRESLQEGWRDPTTPGELNYAITVLCLDYLHSTGIDYYSLNSVVGVLECAKQELYRRVIAPYEDTKIKENGDVYATAG